MNSSVTQAMRQEATHTPGPWTIDEVRTSSGLAFRIGVGEMLVPGKGCCIIYDDYPASLDNERRANAHLISAAPDLYAAIKNSDDAHWTPAMRAAMAKAEGKS